MFPRRRQPHRPSPTGPAHNSQRPPGPRPRASPGGGGALPPRCLPASPAFRREKPSLKAGGETETAASHTGSGSLGHRKWWAFWVICCLYSGGEVPVVKFAALPWESMALETVPKDLRHLRACLLCSLVKVCIGNLERWGTNLGEGRWNGMREAARRHCLRR